ncbi:N-acetyltransferase [Frondihabitans sucicola]|uniref:N-acetyltransferase n=1 Tax=Frondihabitans sucicola TaxID=1268041 RepID=A0ABM8GSI5_9MICO|nr:GNAT family N-acetyltransferase [Frondihabitans sucicola]BDZ51380.1 N-acetyltransferase [Frondihabitans sucicola]
MTDDECTYLWRGDVDDDELSILHAAAFAGAVTVEPWRERLERHSLGWVTARRGGRLVGFVNVVGDGGRHAFLVDTTVWPNEQGRGIGSTLVRRAIAECIGTTAEWVHVDFEPGMESFYLRPDAFRPTPAGLLRVVGSD